MAQTAQQYVQSPDRPAGSYALLAATIVYVALIIAALAIVGTLPAAAETSGQVVAWFREHREAMRAATWAFTVATLPLAVMLACLRAMLPALYRDVFTIGGVVVLVCSAVQIWFGAGLALHADRLDPAIARTVLDVAVFFGPVLTGATTTMIGPVTLLALRGRAGLPMWLGLLGAVAFIEQSIETITIFGTTGFTQPGGAMNFQLGAALTLAWMLAFGLWGGLRGRMAERAA